MSGNERNRNVVFDNLEYAVEMSNNNNRNGNYHGRDRGGGDSRMMMNFSPRHYNHLNVRQASSNSNNQRQLNHHSNDRYSYSDHPHGRPEVGYYNNQSQLSHHSNDRYSYSRPEVGYYNNQSQFNHHSNDRNSYRDRPDGRPDAGYYGGQQYDSNRHRMDSSGGHDNRDKCNANSKSKCNGGPEDPVNLFESCSEDPDYTCKTDDELLTMKPVQKQQRPSKKSKPSTTIPPNSPNSDHDVSDAAEARKKGYKHCLPNTESIDKISPQAWNVKEGHNGLAQRQAAAKMTLEKIKNYTTDTPPARRQDKTMYDSDSSSDDEPQSGKPFLSQAHKIFISALPYCIPLDAGFNILRCYTDADKYCYCPCSRMLEPWRKNNELDCTQCQTNTFTPNGLMAHLKEEGGLFRTRDGPIPLKDIHHFATKLYLENLYNDWHGKRKPMHLYSTIISISNH